MSVDRLSIAQQAAQRGDRVLARKLVSQVIYSDPRNEQAWLMMARLVDSEPQMIECLERALRINRDNVSTQNALKILKRRASSREKASTTSSGVIASAKPVPVGGKSQSQPLVTKSLAPDYERSNGREYMPPHRKTNWSLIIGSLIVFFVILIGVIGTQIAPHDPMEESAIIKIGDEWYVPPLDAFSVMGYTLGTDEFGRDLMSRLLYAVRPTLIMVIIVASVRLILGTLIGLGAGYSEGRIGRFLDILITAALSVPILLVALGAIAMLGAEIGLLAFIVGLSINGWGETARFMSEQTRLIKGQLYVESAHAMGASSLQILIRHVLRQVMPMIWMLFAFEISGTLLVTAGLGFLGYFIGGDVWVEVADFVSRRTSGAPELGQMLATSWVNLLQPWPLVLTGSVVFITILGFNLLGDGLRARLNPEYINRNSPLALLSHRLGFWFEESISYPISTWLKGNRLRPVLVGCAVIALAGGTYLFQTRYAEMLNPARATLSVPGGQIWASERIDPYGTMYQDFKGLKNASRWWSIRNVGEFSGSPAISADGTIYLARLDKTLMAINPDGTVRWERDLAEIPEGPLAISPEGVIYINDVAGGLSAYSPEGNLIWVHTVEAVGRAKHGPIVSPQGTIYYLLEDARGDTLFALLPNGQLLWSAQPGTRNPSVGLRLTPDGQQLFIKNTIISTQDGSPVELTLPTDNSLVLASKAQLFVGADGKKYLLAGHVVMQWEQTDQGFNLVQSTDWDYRGLGIVSTSSLPIDAAVTPKGNIVLFYSGRFEHTRVVWLDPTGRFIGSINSAMYQGTRLVSVDENEHVTLCGVAPTEHGENTAMCEAYQADNQEPLWEYTLGDDIDGIVGAAMTPRSLLVATGKGSLVSLIDTTSLPSTPTSIP